MAIESATIALGASVSASFPVQHENLVGIYVPQMEATTEYLYVQWTGDVNTELADADRTFVYLKQGGSASPGDYLAVPVSASAAQAVSLHPDYALIPGRIRFEAVTVAGAAVVQTAAKAVVAYTRRRA